MDRNVAKQMAEDLFLEHAPDLVIYEGWKFGGFTRAKKTLGMCDPNKKVIVLSGEYVDHNSVERIEQTILHEIAHAVAGSAAGHGAEWLRVARSIGYTEGRQGEAYMPSLKNPLWIAKCGEGCGVGYLRKPGVRMARHAICNKHGIKVVWTNTRTGEVL